MSLLIDGYNLLHEVGILGHGVGPGGLHRARLALLNFLAHSLDPQEIAHTAVVFDAHDAPWGLPDVVEHHGLTVRFATKFDDADSLIEELIRTDSAPRRLTVVSSDHRLQRAARHRRAKAINAVDWFTALRHRREQRHRPALESADAEPRPSVPLLEEDIEYWVAQFGGQSLLSQLIADESAQSTSDTPDTSPAKRDAPPPPPDKPTPEEMAQIGNPFPPGYAEDLLDQADLSK